MKEVYLISGNQGKINEFKEFFPEIKSYNLDLMEIQSLDSESVITHKLKEAYTYLLNNNILHFDYIIVEDTSLYIEALKGLPGTFIKFFLKSIGNDGISHLTYSYSNNNKAFAKTSIGLIDKNQNTYFFEGKIEGIISSTPRGENGFGWDKIFIPNGADKTFAEMTFSEKANYNMRKKALEKLKERLNNF